MKYRTKVRELEAIRFDGTNVEAIKTLTGLRFELMETPQNVKYLLYGDGLVNLGDWVGVEDGKIKSWVQQNWKMITRQTEKEQ